ncbi:MAG: UDP-glucose 4-epimerase GalE [Immundisolibacteraceae bacterium]|nr:UDP-glucose 4-epimerase GalE [Immundisolibacteraceae bacterium]
MSQGKVLVTGGAGYIGSHTCVQLLEAGYSLVVLDNLSNSSIESLRRVEQITGRNLEFVEGDISDRTLLDELFTSHQIDSVIHFAGLKAVGESVAQPIRYYQNNVAGTLVLCGAMAAHGVSKIVFSSSATVYGDPASVPIDESFPLSATNPYGRSKLHIEEMLRDFVVADQQANELQNPWSIVLLRYFNPAGAHPSGQIGEDPNGIPNNLMPYICQVAVGKLKQLSVFGGDYDTVDGSGVRDYIHVVDLANGHLQALKKLAGPKAVGVSTYNLGTGHGYSVIETVKAFERASGQSVPYQVVGRRAGDIAACYADPALAATELDWQASFNLDDMCRDAWRWQQSNPEGY